MNVAILELVFWLQAIVALPAEWNFRLLTSSSYDFVDSFELMSSQQGHKIKTMLQLTPVHQRNDTELTSSSRVVNFVLVSQQSLPKLAD